jgi:hypothetical protein
MYSSWSGLSLGSWEQLLPASGARSTPGLPATCYAKWTPFSCWAMAGICGVG